MLVRYLRINHKYILPWHDGARATVMAVALTILVAQPLQAGICCVFPILTLEQINRFLRMTLQRHIYNFQQSGIVTWRMRELVRRE